MVNRHWMPLYVADYLGDTRHLSTLEHGAYLLLIMHYWQTDALPADEAKLARIAGLTGDEWRDVRPTLAALFADGWRHARIEHELAEAARRTENARRAGKMSAQSRATRVEPPLRSGGNDSATPRQPRARVSQPQSSEAGASATACARASPERQAGYSDARHALWGEGVPVLAQLGIAEKSARANIGRWLRDAGDDARAVLGAIERAREHRVIDPIPWITRALQTKGRNHADDRSVHAGIDRVLARLREFGPAGEQAYEPGCDRAGADGTGSGSEPRESDVRLLSQG